MSMVLPTAASWNAACPPFLAGLGPAFMSPLMMLGASMALWRYTSARAWSKGTVTSLKGTWSLKTFSCHQSPTTS